MTEEECEIETSKVVMEDEEKLAEEWLDERYLKDMGVRKPCKEAYLAGLKAGKQEKWHDLHKDPNDVDEVMELEQKTGLLFAK